MPTPLADVVAEAVAAVVVAVTEIVAAVEQLVF